MAAVEVCVVAWLAWGVVAGLMGGVGGVRGLFWVDLGDPPGGNPEICCPDSGRISVFELPPSNTQCSWHMSGGGGALGAQASGDLVSPRACAKQQLELHVQLGLQLRLELQLNAQQLPNMQKLEAYPYRLQQAPSVLRCGP